MPQLNVLPLLKEVHAERRAQLEKFGPQEHPNGTDSSFSDLADAFREDADRAAAEGNLTWRQIMLEEVYEALSETDPVKLRAELIQVMSVASSWIDNIDSAVTPSE